MVLAEIAPPPSSAASPAATIARLKRLLNLTLALNSVGETERLLGLVLRTAMDVADCEAASILLLDERTGDLRFAAASGEAGAQLVGTKVPVDASLAGIVVREDRVLHAAEAGTDTRRYARTDAETGFVTRVLLGIPMRIDGEPVGVLQALNPNEGSFNQSDVEVLLVVAAQAAVAIRNARHEQALTEANAKMAELDRLKTNFVAITSHELRTPITAVRGFGTILAEEVHEALQPYAEAVVEASERMVNVVETLDVMSELQGEMAVRQGCPVPLTDVLADAIGEDSRGRVSVTLPEDSLFVSGDAGRLRLAFGNLVRNAVQFSPPGSPVRIEAEASGEEVRVRVVDQGRGLAAADLDGVFDAYIQVDDPDRRDHEGLGVGLTVARAILLQHGGRVWAESPGLGRGATFHVCLPLAVAASPTWSSPWAVAA